MTEKIYFTNDGRYIEEKDLTPELRKEIIGADDEEEGEYDIRQDYESEEDFARGEGFWIDDDGHWVPIDEGDDLYW